MKTIVLTGGIATGKSSAMRMLRHLDDGKLRFYDCDASVARILASGIVSAELVALFGKKSVDDDGIPDRSYLRRLIFKDAAARSKLEQLLHPMLLQECLAEIDDARQNPSVRGFIVDVPLYYEAAFSCGEDAVCVVAVSQATQQIRFGKRNGYSREMVKMMLSAQWPIQEKVKRADTVIWNEGPIQNMEEQIQRFYQHHFI